jgi:2-keto-4-pentenoate hydratase
VSNNPNQHVKDIASSFVNARAAGAALAAFPGIAPTTLVEAYAVQDAGISLTPDVIAGWKVGRILPPLDAQYGAERVCGPVFSTLLLLQDGATPQRGKVFGGGFGAAEAELLLRIGDAPPRGKSDYTLESAAALIDRVHIGIEIASSPFAGVNDIGPTAIVSDFGNNNGLVIGPEVADWQNSGYADWEVVTRIDGTEVGRGRANAFPDGPLGSVHFLLNNLGERGIDIAPGTWVSTGAITGVHIVGPGAHVEARFGDALVTSCTVEAVATN